MSRSPRRRDGIDPLKAGVIALLALLLFTYAGWTKFRIPFQAQYEIQAVFPSAATGLKAGSPVRIAGVEVGRVVGMEKGEGGTAIATLRFKDEGRPVHRDATMKIRPRLFLEGNFFVDVKPGTPEVGEVPDEGTIPIAQTSVAVQLDEVLGALQSDSREDLQKTLENLATAFDGGAAEAVNRGFESWEGAFKGTAIVSEAARGRRPGDLTRFIQSQARISGALAARDSELADLVTGFSRTVTALADSGDDVGASLRALDSTLTTARPALTEIETALPPLRSFAEALRPALRVAPDAIDDAVPFVRATSSLLSDGELPALVRDLRPAVTGLRTLEPSLTRLLTKATPIGTCVSRNIVPTLNKKLEDGIHTVDRTVWQELAGFAVGLSSAGGNFDANGATIRYHAGGGENLVSTALPGVGDLVSLSEEPLLGARPRYTPNTVPPFAPTVACETQDLPDLRAEATPRPTAQRRVSLSQPARRAAVQTATKRLLAFDGPADVRRAMRAARTAAKEATR